MRGFCVVAIALHLLLVAGCTSTLPRFTASVDDYASYRRVRTAESLGGRLRAAQEYLEKRPNGAFADEIRALWEDEEPQFFEATKASRGRAVEYLTFLPNGPHAEAAHSQLLAWDIRIEEGEGASLLAQARRTEASLAGAALQRKQVGETIFEALRAIGDAKAYGAPIDDAPLELRRFLAGTTGPTWGRMPTRVTRDLFFFVPTKLERESRVVSVTLSMALANGLVKSGRLSAPNLFLHWLEADSMTALDPTGNVDRKRARNHARERLEGFFEASLPAARCSAKEREVAPVVLMRACEGWTLRVAQGTGIEGTEGGDDIVELAR